MGFGMALCVPGIYFLARGFDFDPRALPEQLVGEPAPSFSLTSFDGYEISFADLQGSRSSLIFGRHGVSLVCRNILICWKSLKNTSPKEWSFWGFCMVILKRRRDFFTKTWRSISHFARSTQRTSIDYGVAGVRNVHHRSIRSDSS